MYMKILTVFGKIKLYCFTEAYFFFFFVTPMACGGSWARDQICTTVTRATAVTTPYL